MMTKSKSNAASKTAFSTRQGNGSAVKKAAQKIGRPSKFGTVDPAQVEKLAKAGWTDRQMADFFNVVEQTWNNWKKQNEAFLESLKDWKAEADHKVERGLYERATGYEHPEVHISNFQGDVTITDIVKHYPPDTTACIFWLKNRQPQDWRDRTERELTGKGGGPIEKITKIMTHDEASAAYAATLNNH